MKLGRGVYGQKVIGRVLRKSSMIDVEVESPEKRSAQNDRGEWAVMDKLILMKSPRGELGRTVFNPIQASMA